MSPLVSILIPVYKAERYIEKCVISLLEQTYKNLEFIFVDDCTPDNSMAVLQETLKRYPDANFTILHNQKNQGIAQTRNILLENASGQYIYFIDSDDYIDPETIEYFVDIATENNADIVRQCFYEVNEKQVIKHTNAPFTDKQSLLSNTIIGNALIESMPILFIKRSLFTENNLAFVKGINICEDWIMSIKLFYYANRIVDIKEAHYYYVRHNNDSLTKNKQKALADKQAAIPYVEQFLREHGIYEEQKESVCIRKFKCKQALLIDKELANLEKYRTTFPESDRMWRHYNYAGSQKVLFWLAEKNLYWVIKLIFKITWRNSITSPHA